jgi:hypothetical protein
MNRCTKLFFFFLFLISAGVEAQPRGQWMWIHGSNINYDLGSFGIRGVTSPSNTPPAIYSAFQWQDLNGNFWLFGGVGSTGSSAVGFNALWKYEPLINQWTWMHGSDSFNSLGHYGIQGIPDTANTPRARNFAGASWIDLDGDLWLYGGFHGGLFSDLWKYDIETNMWTWMKGDSTVNNEPIHGIQGIPSINNSPGGRIEFSTAWVDNSGDLWLFGGRAISGTEYYNDLWRYNINSNMWTWMKGSNLTNQSGVYGTRGIESPNNTPGARWSYAHWKDTDGNFWLCGGVNNYPYNYYNDLWRFNPLTNNWTWINGSNSTNSSGSYGQRCIIDSTNGPSARWENRSCITDVYGNFWMFGGGRIGSFEIKEDLWSYCPTSNNWTWQAGSSSINTTPYWGIINVPNISNNPGSRIGALAWSDSSYIYLFGGYSSPNTAYNSLFRFNMDPECGPCSISTNIIDKANPSITIYPNPTSSSFTIESSYPLYQITLSTTEGRTIKIISNIHSLIFNVDMSDLSAGIYFLDCETEKGREMVKVVKY